MTSVSYRMFVLGLPLLFLLFYLFPKVYLANLEAVDIKTKNTNSIDKLTHKGSNIQTGSL